MPRPPRAAAASPGSRRVRTDSGRVDRSWAAYRTIETFRSSDGWNWNAPAPIQRVAPFTVTPMPGSIAATVSAKEPASSSGVSARMTLSPCRDARCRSTSPASPNMT